MKLTTWAQICKAKGIDAAIPFDVSKLDKKLQVKMIAGYMLPIIIEVKNAEIKPAYKPWIPDYTDMSQYKYENLDGS